MDLHTEVARAVVAKKMEARARDDRARTDERDEWDQPVAKEEPHRVGIGRAASYEEGPTA
jgi:hypothetical protein